jgi:hypothetical protein
MSRRIHGLEARVSKMESKLCALCLELKQVQQILITNTNKFSPYVPNVSHHVEVEAEEHQSLEDPLAEMVKILVPSCAHLSPNSLVDLMVRPRFQEQVLAIHKPLQSFVVQIAVKSLKAPSHKKHVLFGELVPNTLARKGILNVAPSRLAMAVADGQQLAVETRSLERDKHTQVVEWQASKHVITQMLPEYETQILTQIVVVPSRVSHIVQ